MSKPAPVEPPKRPHRVGRALGKFALGIGAGLGLGGVFLATFAVAAIAHLDAPSARRALAPILSDLASDPFKGRIDIKDIEHISLRRGWIDVGEITVRDQEGTPVISAYGAHVRFGLIQLGKAFLSKTGAVPSIDRVVVDRVNVALIPSTADGSPTVAGAFESKVPGGTPPGPPKSVSTFKLAIADASVRELGVFGSLAGMPLDVRGQALHANAEIMPDATWVNVEGASLAIAPIAGVTNAPTYLDAATEVRIPVVSDPRSIGPELRNLRVDVRSGDLRASIRGHVEQTAVSAHVSIPQTSPTALGSFLGGVPPIPVPASAEIDVDGTIDRADVVAHAKIGDGSITLGANVDLAALAQKPGPEQPRIGIAEGHLLVAGIAPRTFAPGAPPLTVGTDAIIRATATTAGIEVTVKGNSTGAPEKGNAATVDIDVQALLGNGSVTAKGDVVAKAEGAKAEVRFDFEQHLGGGTVNAAVTANIPKIEALAGFVPGVPIRGGVDVVADLGADLGKQTFGLTATVHGRSISHPAATIPEVAIIAHAGGTFSEPEFGAIVEAQKIVLSPKDPQPVVLHDVNAKIAGTPKLIGVGGHVRTDLGQNIDLATHLSPTPMGVDVAGTRVLLKRGNFVGDLAIKRLSVVGSTIKIDGFRLSSTAGGVRLDGTFDPKKKIVDFDVASTELDIDAIARAAGIEDGAFRGKVILDVKLATLAASQRKWLTESAATESSLLHVEDKPTPAKVKSSGAPYLSGRIHIDLRDGHSADVDDLAAHVDVGIEDRLVEGYVDVAVKDLARVMVRGAAMVPGRIDDLKAWSDAIGRVDLHVPTIDLTKVEAFLAKRAKEANEPPPLQLSGSFALHGHIERANKDGAPSGWINGWTKDFAFAQGGTAITGVDLRIKASLESSSAAQGENGKPDPNAPIKLDLVADAHDKKGSIAIVHVGTEGTWNKLLKKGAALGDMPVVADLLVPARALHDLPPSLAKSIPIDGVLGMSATVRGTIGAPKLEMVATVDQLIGEGGAPHIAVFTTSYDGEKAKVHLDFAPHKNPDNKQLLLDSEIAFSAKDALAGKMNWSAKGDLELVKFPLGIAGGAFGLRGQANGKIHLDHVNDPNAKSPTVDGRIDFAKLKIGDTAFDQAYVVVKVDDQSAGGELVLHGGKSGTVDAKVKVPLVWKNASSASLATTSPIEGNVDIKGLRLSLIKPFVDALDEVDGRLDAHVEAKLTKNAKGQWTSTPEGTVTVREGVIVAGSVGSRWSDVTADVEIKNGKITIKQIVMKSLGRGNAKITGEAVLDGFVPKTFHVQLDAKRFAVAASGAKIGDFTGKVSVDGKMTPNGDDRDRLDVTVNLDDITMDLAAEAGKQVQSLEMDPSIMIAQPVGKPIPPPGPPGKGTPINVKVVIPHPMWIRRDDLRIAVDGNPSMAIDGIAKLSGEVVIHGTDNPWQQRSWVEVAGKRFFIRESTVRFSGSDQLDPALDVHVRWKAPDNTIVEVSVTGHVSAPKIDFKALDSNGNDAGLSKGEVMSLLVLGRRDAGSAQQQQQAESGAASQAAGLVQGMTGAILGKQLQKVLPVSVSLTVAPGRYAGGYQHDNLYFEVGYNAGGAQMGPTSIGQTQPKTTFTVDWRFAKLWSLVTTVGDTGATLVDLIWTYRY